MEFSRFLIEVYTTTGITTRAVPGFTYKDGNGDIGLNINDIDPPFNPGSKYYYNLIIHSGLFIYNPLSNYDTIRFSFYIYGALHKSNKVTTPERIRTK